MMRHMSNNAKKDAELSYKTRAIGGSSEWSPYTLYVPHPTPRLLKFNVPRSHYQENSRSRGKARAASTELSQRQPCLSSKGTDNAPREGSNFQALDDFAALPLGSPSAGRGVTAAALEHLRLSLAANSRTSSSSVSDASELSMSCPFVNRVSSSNWVRCPSAHRVVSAASPHVG